MLKQITTKKAPSAIGPYSQAIKAGSFLFCSGQLPIDPKSGVLVEGIEAQTKQVLQNLLSVLKEAGGDFSNVVRTDIFLLHIQEFAKVNGIYASYFSTDPKPARQTAAVASLPKNALIEISCIAFLP